MRNIHVRAFRRAAHSGGRIYLDECDRVVATGSGVTGWWRGRQVRQEVSDNRSLQIRGQELLERFRQSVKEHYGKDCYAQLNWSRTWGMEAGGLAADEVSAVLQEADGVVSEIEELNRGHRDAFLRLAECGNNAEPIRPHSPDSCLKEIVSRCLRENGLDPEWSGPWNEGLWIGLMMENLPGFRFKPVYSRGMEQGQGEDSTEPVQPLKLYITVDEIAERTTSTISAYVRMVAERGSRLPFWWKQQHRAAYYRLMFHPSMASIRSEWREDAIRRLTACAISRDAERRKTVAEGVFLWEGDCLEKGQNPDFGCQENQVWNFFFHRPLPVHVTSTNLWLHLYQVIRINDIRSKLARGFFDSANHSEFRGIFLNWTGSFYLRGISGFEEYEKLAGELKATLERQGPFLPFPDPAVGEKQEDPIFLEKERDDLMHCLRSHPSLAEIPAPLHHLVLAILTDVFRANHRPTEAKSAPLSDPGAVWQRFFRGLPPPETLRTDNLVARMLGRILMDHPPRLFPGARDREFDTIPLHCWIFLIHSDGMVPWVIGHDMMESIRYLIGRTGARARCRYQDALLLEAVKQKKVETVRLVLRHDGSSDTGRHHAMTQVLGEGDRKFLELLFQNGISATTWQLTLAIQNEFPECVDVILQFCPELLNVVNRWNDTPLQSAYYQGHVPTLEVLLKKGADTASLINEMGELQSDMHSWRIPHPAFIRTVAEMGAGVYSIMDRIYRESQYGPPRPAELLVLLEHGLDPEWRFADNRITLNEFAIHNEILLDNFEILRQSDLHVFGKLRWPLVDDYRKRLDDEIFNDATIQTSDGRGIRINRRLMETRIGCPFTRTDEVLKRYSEPEVCGFLRWVYTGISSIEEEKAVRRICLDLGISAREFSRKTGPRGFIHDMVWLSGQEVTRDFTIVAKGHLIRVHRMVLAARSELFWNMFATVQNDSSGQVHDSSGISPAAWRVMIRYMYTGRLEFGELRKQPKVVGELMEHHRFFLLHPNEENRENPFSLVRKLEEYMWLLKD